MVDISVEKVTDNGKDKLKTVLSDKADKNLPLIDLMASEGGPPCLIPSENNKQADKKSYMLLPKTYYDGCETEI